MLSFCYGDSLELVTGRTLLAVAEVPAALELATLSLF